ncbi:SHOCT domain-containing protein [Halosimplex halophilum]|uniref:SHOCT domain-containing protein n=1 Tax=Halosimplex halophilum TaxID=2559572 RepID=UPI001FE9976B|nr:SHOCT domain-containing protein [Halosimplex halophilum]
MFEALRSLGTVTRRFVALLPVLIAVATLPVALLALFNAGVVTALEIAVTGWLFATPVTAILAWVVLDLSPVDLPGSLGDRSVDLPSMLDGGASDGGESAGDDPVETLRERFANGEIDQTEFERRLDALLATEDATDGRPSDGRPGDDPSGTAGSVSAREPAAADESRAPSSDRSRAPGRDREPEST